MSEGGGDQGWRTRRGGVDLGRGTVPRLRRPLRCIHQSNLPRLPIVDAVYERKVEPGLEFWNPFLGLDARQRNEEDAR